MKEAFLTNHLVTLRYGLPRQVKADVGFLLVWKWVDSPICSESQPPSLEQVKAKNGKFVLPVIQLGHLSCEKLLKSMAVSCLVWGWRAGRHYGRHRVECRLWTQAFLNVSGYDHFPDLWPWACYLSLNSPMRMMKNDNLYHIGSLLGLDDTRGPIQSLVHVGHMGNAFTNILGNLGLLFISQMRLAYQIVTVSPCPVGLEWSNTPSLRRSRTLRPRLRHWGAEGMLPCVVGGRLWHKLL